jgi:3-hydroxybutyryl-CoA dehydrogenase
MPVFESTAVLGFGAMGSGIAQVVAASGRQVLVLESDLDRLEAGMARVRAFLDAGVARAKVTEGERDAVLDRITGTISVEDLRDVDLVIEAITEVRAVKAELFGRVADVVRSDTVIVTNTSALSVSDLATSVSHPERFAGLHFFNPAQLMRIVEIVRGLDTEQCVLDRLGQFAQEIGKDAVLVKDRPGFLVNRLLIPYLNDVVQALDDELASAEDIDVAIRLGLGHKMGPLELMDLIGLDIHAHATRSAYDATLDPAFAPPPLLQTMVAAGRLGNKSKSGFRTEKVQ